MGVERRGSGAAAHDLGVESLALEQTQGPRQIGVQSGQQLPLLRPAFALPDVARVEGDPGEPERWAFADQTGQLDRLLRRGHADPVHPQVYLDQHSHLAIALPGRGGQTLDRLGAVQRHHGAHLGRQCQEALQLGEPDRWIGKQQVAGQLRHHLRLPQRGAGQPDRPAAELLRGDPRRLVGLDVGAELDPVSRGIPRHPVQVSLHDVEVH